MIKRFYSHVLLFNDETILRTNDITVEVTYSRRRHVSVASHGDAAGLEAEPVHGPLGAHVLPEVAEGVLLVVGRLVLALAATHVPVADTCKARMTLLLR